MIGYLLLVVVLAGATEPAPKVDPPAAKAEPAKAPAPDSKKPVEPPPNLGGGLKQVSPDTWEITRDEAYLLIASMPFVARQLWVSEVRRDGKLAGYKLRHIAAGSPVERAGLKNDDILMTVNGQGLEEPLKLLLHLLDTDRIEIDLERDGKAIQQIYRFVP
jgi:type II secretory pathway component PulC